MDTIAALASPTLRNQWREALADLAGGSDLSDEGPVDALLAIEDAILATPEAHPGLWLEVFLRRGDEADARGSGTPWAQARQVLKLIVPASEATDPLPGMYARIQGLEMAIDNTDDVEQRATFRERHGAMLAEVKGMRALSSDGKSARHRYFNERVDAGDWHEATATAQAIIADNAATGG